MAKRPNPLTFLGRNSPARLEMPKRGAADLTPGSKNSRTGIKNWRSAPGSPLAVSPNGLRRGLERFSELASPELHRRNPTSIIGSHSLAKTTHFPRLPAYSPDDFTPSDSHARYSLPPSRKLTRPIHTRSNTESLRPSATLEPISPSLQAPSQAIRNVVARCAFKSRTGTVLGKPKKFNQDSYIILPVFGGLRGQYLFSVCDGHGIKGHEVSGFVKDHMPGLIENKLKLIGNDLDAADYQIRQSLADAIQDINAKLTYSCIEVAFSGTTCVTVLVRDNHLWCANVGDSRAVIGQKSSIGWAAFELSKDHKPENPGELQRVLAAGGRVEPFKDSNGKNMGPFRVWLKNEGIPGLAMSRSLGDVVAHSVGVSSTADVVHHNLSHTDCFMIIASDGLWEFISNFEAVLLASQAYEQNDFQGCCDRLLNEAVNRWKRNDQMIDDITIIVVFFKVS